jgi:hypothetical protein
VKLDSPIAVKVQEVAVLELALGQAGLAAVTGVARNSPAEATIPAATTCAGDVQVPRHFLIAQLPTLLPGR